MAADEAASVPLLSVFDLQFLHMHLTCLGLMCAHIARSLFDNFREAWTVVVWIHATSLCCMTVNLQLQYQLQNQSVWIHTLILSGV